MVSLVRDQFTRRRSFTTNRKNGRSIAGRNHNGLDRSLALTAFFNHFSRLFFFITLTDLNFDFN